MDLGAICPIANRIKRKVISGERSRMKSGRVSSTLITMTVAGKWILKDRFRKVRFNRCWNYLWLRSRWPRYVHAFFKGCIWDCQRLFQGHEGMGWWWILWFLTVRRNWVRLSSAQETNCWPSMALTCSVWTRVRKSCSFFLAFYLLCSPGKISQLVLGPEDSVVTLRFESNTEPKAVFDVSITRRRARPRWTGGERVAQSHEWSLMRSLRYAHICSETALRLNKCWRLLLFRRPTCASASTIPILVPPTSLCSQTSCRRCSIQQPALLPSTNERRYMFVSIVQAFLGKDFMGLMNIGCVMRSQARDSVCMEYVSNN